MALKTQIIIIAISIGLLIGIIELIRRKRLKEEYSLFWIVIGLSLLIFSSSSHLLKGFSSFFGIHNPPAALFFMAFILLFLLLIHFSVVISELATLNKDLAEEVSILKWRIANIQEQKCQQKI